MKSDLIKELEQELQMCCGTCAQKQKMLDLLDKIKVEFERKDKVISYSNWEKYPDRMGG